MNRTFFFLTGLCLLLLAFACRHMPDVVPADPELPISETVTTPTGSTILSTTYTIPASPETAYANVPQPPADCRIIKMTYKTVRYGGPITDPEYVTVGKTTFQVSTRYTTTYTYDNQRRLVWERRLLSTGQPDSVRYVYGSGQVLKYRYEYVPNDRYYSDTTVYPVDARGYPVSVADRQRVDADGFLIRRGKDAPNEDLNWATWIIKDLNISSGSSYVAGGFGVTTSMFDDYKLRINLPSLTPFINRSSQKLAAKKTIIASGSVYWKDGVKFGTLTIPVVT